MVYAERGNRVISIKEESIDKYVNQGYLIYDEAGTIIKDTVPNDVAKLKKAYIEHKAEIDSLKAEIEKLNAQIDVLTKAQPKKTATAEVVDNSVVEEGDVPEVQSKRTRRTNKAE